MKSGTLCNQITMVSSIPKGRTISEDKETSEKEVVPKKTSLSFKNGIRDSPEMVTKVEWD